MPTRNLFLPVLGMLVCACASDNQSNNQAVSSGGTSTDVTPTGGATTGGGGSGGLDVSASGGSTPAETGCNLPAAGASGVAAPTGAPGGLRVLDWAGFTAAVSYTFDDANSSQIAHYDTLQGLGVPMTFYLQTGKSEAADPTWQQALSDGHELGNHTQTHPRDGTAEELDGATQFIQDQFGVTPYTMAAPYGDSSYVSLAEGRFLINRGVGGGSIAPLASTNPFNLPCSIPSEEATASDMNSVIDSARSAGKWQIVLLHGFTGGSDYAYQPVAIEEFASSVDHAKSFGDVWVDTVMHVGAYWIAQKLVSDSSPQTAEGTTTWSWTLPPNFPPGQCLRVSVDGGTLAQGGQPLAWDEHGYFEVALDAGSMSLTE